MYNVIGVENTLNGQGISKVYGNQNDENGRKVQKKRRGYDLEKL